MFVSFISQSLIKGEVFLFFSFLFMVLTNVYTQRVT